MKLSIVVSYYNALEYLQDCLVSIRDNAPALESEVIVVDDASERTCAQVVRDILPSARLLINETNLGFAAANNVGWRSCSGEYVLFLNSDTKVLPGALDELVAYLDHKSTVGVVGPQVLNADGSLQPQCRRGRLTPLSGIGYSLRLDRVLPDVAPLSEYLMRHRDPMRTHRVRAVSGCCMLVRREVLDREGGFDESLIQYGEDLDLCYRIDAAGWRVMYRPSAQIVHYGGQGGTNFRLWRSVYLFHRNLWVVMWRHGRTRLFPVSTMLGFAMIGARFGLASIAHLLGHKRAGTRKGAERFKPRVPLLRAERQVLLVAIDLIALAVGLYAYLQVHPGPYGSGLPDGYVISPRIFWDRPQWFLLLMALWLPVAKVLDSFRLQVASRPRRSLGTATQAALVVLVAYAFIPFLTPVLPPSRRYLAALVALPWLGLMIGRLFFSVALGQSYFRRPTIVVGTGWAARTIAHAIHQNDDGSYRVLGFLSEDADKLGAWVPATATPEEFGGDAVPEEQQYPVLGSAESLRALVRQYGVKTLVQAETHELRPQTFKSLMDCLELGVEVIPMSQLYERLTGRVPVEHIGEDWHVAMPLEHPGNGLLRPLVSRVTDLTLAVLGLVVTAPLLPIIAAAIYIDSQGPIFYKQARVGKGGRLFNVYKFRSMRSDAEEDTAVWSEPGDPRITRLGRFLRAVHLDEMPQLLNVLRGDMSAVGPRPERPEFLEELSEEIPFYSVRHAVKPGMAGWALINVGYGHTKRHALLKLQYDLYYIKHQSLGLDLVILVKSALHSLGFQGR